MDEWRRIGELIDRILMVAFLMVVVCGSVAVFVKVPHIAEPFDEEGTKLKYSKNYDL